MINLKEIEIWFITGSQHLYGPGPLAKVAEHSKEIAAALDAKLPVKIVFKPVLTGPDAISELCRQANATANCAGVIAWMHTFSPAKMWIAGLSMLSKPLAHLHTQYGRDIPWASIDMDFMNLNQSAHGDREFGFIGARLRKARKIVVGHWQDKEVIARLDCWARAAAGWHDAQGARFARIGDNMREVAVTEGDKVEAQRVFGYSVNGYGLGDLVAHVNAATDQQVEQLCKEYDERYVVAKELGPKGTRRSSLRDAARIELGLRSFLTSGSGGFKGFTDTFENLHGLKQLPGIAVQRLMNDGYGFGAEGDWKTAALLRAMKVMATGLAGGTSFMEDYTYHLDSKGMLVLGAHMLEICESIAAKKPSCEIHPLGIGGREDPVRLVFDTPAGPALNASVIDLGNRFRMIVNTVDVVKTPHALPKLPVARAVWKAHPDLKIAAGAWILAGGAHHTGFSQALTVEHMRDFTDIAGIEFLLIDEKTDIHQFKKELQWNEVFYHLAGGLR